MDKEYFCSKCSENERISKIVALRCEENWRRLNKLKGIKQRTKNNKNSLYLDKNTKTYDTLPQERSCTVPIIKNGNNPDLKVNS